MKTRDLAQLVRDMQDALRHHSEISRRDDDGPAYRTELWEARKRAKEATRTVDTALGRILDGGPGLFEKGETDA